jgi:23S rRNA (cytidine1920-2'-O)/16S rRNA (cytidine1409-2'-O)-methyltransferase
VIGEIQLSADAIGYQTVGVTESPLLGPKGNKEFLIYLRARA